MATRNKAKPQAKRYESVKLPMAAFEILAGFKVSYPGVTKQKLMTAALIALRDADEAVWNAALRETVELDLQSAA